jgi:hypothetical protein
MVMQQRDQRSVQFEITEQTRQSLLAWIRDANRRSDDYLFPNRIHGSPHLGIEVEDALEMAAQTEV